MTQFTPSEWALKVIDQYKNELELISLNIITTGKYTEAQYIEALQYLQALKDAPTTMILPTKLEWL